MTDPDKWSSCVFRVSSSRLSVAEITRVLNSEPTSAQDKGEPKSKRAPERGVRDFSVWLMESGVGDDKPLNEHLAALLPFIESHAEEIRSLSKDCTVDLVCGFSSGNGQGGFVLEHDVLKKIGEAGLDIVLDLYPPERKE